MTKAEFERRIGTQAAAVELPAVSEPTDANLSAEFETGPRSQVAVASRQQAARAKPAKPRRIQRMFAIEEYLDKKL
jgi:hypothetical protein